MSKKVKAKYTIEQVEELPLPKRKLRETIYDDLIRDILSRPKGYYKIAIEGKTMKTMYPALQKRITERKLPFKLRVRSGQLYIEKIE